MTKVEFILFSNKKKGRIYPNYLIIIYLDLFYSMDSEYNESTQDWIAGLNFGHTQDQGLYILITVFYIPHTEIVLIFLSSQRYYSFNSH